MAELKVVREGAQVAKGIEFAPTPEHPEEMRADVGFRFGDLGEFRARARCTPAGVITTGIAAACILLATARLVRAINGR